MEGGGELRAEYRSNRRGRQSLLTRFVQGRTGASP
jgi:hypothetical protein